MGEDRPGSVSKRSGEVSAVGMRMLEVLERHTKFPWPLLKAQCQQRGVEPGALSLPEALAMLDDIIRSLGGLTSVSTAEQARGELQAILKE